MEDKLIFEQDDSFNNLVKKAKRKSLKRSIFISIAVTISTLIIIWILLYVGQYFMYDRMEKDVDESLNYYSLYGANVTPSDSSFDYYFVAGKSTASAIKNVNNHAIAWEERSTFHTILGTKAQVGEPNWQSAGDVPYKNDHKVAQFHLPKEKAIHDDTVYLKSLPLFYSVEVALTFTEKEPLSKVLDSFPTASWFWVLDREEERYADAKSTKEFVSEIPNLDELDYSEVNGDNVIGFSLDENTTVEQAVDYFKTMLEINPGQEDTYEMISEYESSEIPITGVILTGTVDEVLPYITNELVRVVRTGVIIPY